MQLLHAVGRKSDDLSGAELALVVIAELLISVALKRHGIAKLALANTYRQPAHLVTRGDKRAVLTEYQDILRAVDDALRELDALGKARLSIYQRGEQLRSIDSAARHRVKMSVRVLEVLIYELLIVVYDTYVADSVGAEMRAYEQRLGIGIRNNADSRCARHLI